MVNAKRKITFRRFKICRSINPELKMSKYDMRKYIENKPFTKESLLYRKILKFFYKSQSDLIKDFLIPNKTLKLMMYHQKFYQTMENKDTYLLIFDIIL